MNKKSTAYLTLTLTGKDLDVILIKEKLGVAEMKYSVNSMKEKCFSYEVNILDALYIDCAIDNFLDIFYSKIKELNSIIKNQGLFCTMYLVIDSRNTLSDGFELSDKFIEFIFKSKIQFGIEVYNCHWKGEEDL